MKCSSITEIAVTTTIKGIEEASFETVNANFLSERDFLRIRQ
jgi:hypothetical protein